MIVLGIDLGKDKCSVISHDRGHDQLYDLPYLKDQQLFLKGMCFIGTARKKIPPNPKIISLIKRLIGRPFSDPELQQDLKSLDIRVTEGSNGFPLIHAEHHGILRYYTPTEVLEIAFSNMKTLAEMNFNTTTVNCCIGIPIYFTNSQRRAVMHAACDSGLNPLMLMHETTAAAVDYGRNKLYKHGDRVPRNVAFVDIGHASMQVCIAGFYDRECEVLAHSFDRCLGGRDFDEVLFQHFAEKFKLEHKIDVLQNVRAEVRLRRECKNLKEALSQHRQARMNIKRLEGKDVEGFITRQEFEQMSTPILERVKKPLEDALAEAQLTADDILDVQVVGLGASVPAIINMLSKFFRKGAWLQKGRVSSVSGGCTLQCAILSPRFKYSRLLVHERLPFSIALKLNDMAQGSQNGTDKSIIFSKGNLFPCEKVLTFVRSGTFSVDLEYTDFSELKSLPTISRYMIGPFQATNAERAKVMVKVLLTMHGIVSVDSAQLIEEEEGDNAVEMETNTKVESPKKVKNSNIPVIEAAHVQQSMLDCVIEDRMARKNALKAYVYDMRVKLYGELFEFVTVSDRERFIAKLQKIEDWLYGDGEYESGVYVAKLDELKEQGDPLEQRFKDHVIEETKAKKDAVEAYVHEMRTNLHDRLSEFVTDSDKLKLITKLQETMDWLHGDGEDEMKGVYVAKLDELKKLGDPIEKRYKEYSERDFSVSRLTERVSRYRNAASASDASHSNYSHIDEDGRQKVVRACSDADAWLKIAKLGQERVTKHDAPLLLLADIRKSLDKLDRVCKPILYPDVPPKNETDAPNMEDAPGTKQGVVDTRDNAVKMETDSKTMSYTEEEIKKMKLSSKKKKNLRRNRRKKNHHSQEDREQEPVSSSSYPPPASLRVEIAQLINESLKRSYPELLGLVGDFVTVKGDALDMYGDDYQCPNVVDICDKLREKEPDLFKEKGTADIAEDFINNLMKSEMIQQVSIRGGCFVSFKLSWEWMAKRIELMLEKGIDTWAPTYGFKVVVIDFPTPTKNSLVYADFVRSVYIRDSLASMLQYSGVAVPLAVSNWSMYSQPEVDKKFSVQQGEYRKRVDGLVAATPLFVWRKEIGAEVGLYNNVDLDLARLWSGSHLQQADFILYITPAQQRRYVEKCFKAARDVGWLKPNTASCCGYWTSSNEKEKLARLAEEFTFSEIRSLMELVKAAGYRSTPEDFFLCAHRYSYLKTHRLFDCTTTLKEMLDVEGNSLVYLLNTMALVHDIMKTPGQEMFKLKNEFLAKERELALHVVRFTDVVKASCTRFLPHLLCDYLYDLCKKFTSCYSKVRPVASRLLLCKATASVMDKCFLLLKITPEPFTERPLRRFFSTEHKDLLNYFIPWPVSNPNRRRNPRIEMISMQIGMVVDGFDGGQMFGLIIVSDTCQPQPHGWSVLLARDIGHAAYFEQTWCKPVSISDNCHFFFGNPSTPRLVAFDSSMDICTDLMVTCKSNGVCKDACYTICSIKYELKLKEFWEEYRQSKCDTMCFRSEDAKVNIYYILLKDAVDVKVDFRYESSVSDSRGLRVRGHLIAHYGNVLDDVKDAVKMFYKPVIFRTEDTHVTAGHQLRLQKSVFALPSKGCLTIQAFLVDVNSGVVIVDDTRAYHVIPQGSIQWTMRGEFEGKLILTMNWTTGDGVIN